MGTSVTVIIDSSAATMNLRKTGMELAKELGFEGAAMTSVASVFSELTRYVLSCARSGTLVLLKLAKTGHTGVRFTLTVDPPANGKKNSHVHPQEWKLHPDILNFRGHMDEFEITSDSTVVMVKWFR